MFRPARALAFATAFASAPAAHAGNVAFEGSADVYARFVRAMPQLTYQPIANDLRAIPGGKLASTGASGFIGGALDFGVAIDDRWVLPLLGIGGALPVGQRAALLTSIDGSMVELRPWTAVYGELLLPGFGLRFKERRWLFSAALRTAVGFMGMRGSVAGLGKPSPLDLSAASFALRLPIEACRRVDPIERACVVLMPHLYEFGWVSGGTVAVRWEWGP
jgi:hypothetical protein